VLRAVGSTTASSGSASGGTTSSGGQTTSGGTTSGNPPPPPGCTPEPEDTTEESQLEITSCASGTLKLGVDEEDWLTFTRPKGTKLRMSWTGPVLVTFWDEDGRSYDTDHVPNREGSYSIQLQYDFKRSPVSGEQIKQGVTFNWSFTIDLN